MYFKKINAAFLPSHLLFLIEKLRAGFKGVTLPNDALPMSIKAMDSPLWDPVNTKFTPESKK